MVCGEQGDKSQNWTKVMAAVTKLNSAGYVKATRVDMFIDSTQHLVLCAVWSFIFKEHAICKWNEPIVTALERIPAESR